MTASTETTARLTTRLANQAVHWLTLGAQWSSWPAVCCEQQLGGVAPHNGGVDHLAVDYAFYHGVVLDNVNGELAEDYARFRDHIPLLQSVRELLLSGDVGEAISMLQFYGSTILDDRQVMYRLRQQQFVELLRNGQVDQAIQFAREVLSKQIGNFSNLGAFRQIFLLILFGQEHTNSPMSYEWSLARREDLAILVHARLMGSFGVREPTFALLMRYLCTVHNIHHFTHGITPRYDEIDRLLLPQSGFDLDEDDLQPVDVQGMLPSLTGRHNEDDLRGLVQATGISKTMAQHALIHAGGSVSRALRHELCRIRLNHELLVTMVLDYLHLRGLLPPTHEVLQHSRGAVGRQRNGSKLKRSASMMMADSPTSAGHPFSRPMSSPMERLHLIRDELLHTDESTDPRMIIECVQELQPHFDQQFPHLMFRLRQFEVIHALRKGESDYALGVIRTSMTPLAQGHPERLKTIVHLILMCIFKTASAESIPHANTAPSVLKPSSLSSFAGLLYSSLSQSLDVEEPRLSMIMRYLLATHSEQYRHGDTDRFERLFRIPELKRTEATESNETYRASNFGREADEVDTMRPLDHSRPAEPQPPPPPAITDDEIREVAISTLMEIMQYTRERAIDLLRQTDFDLDAVFTELI